MNPMSTPMQELIMKEEEEDDDDDGDDIGGS
jgi:hypothetical protein